MKTRKKQRQGISLIVLVITIIIMIILAGAIILTLNNSGIIGRAEEAREANDKASAKEYVTMLRAEWELMSESEKETAGENFTIFVNNKLNESGEYKSIEPFIEDYLEGNWVQDGTSCIYNVGGKEIVLNVGDYVNYVSQSDNVSYKMESNNSGYMVDGQYVTKTYNKETLNWRVLGVNSNGKLELISDKSTTETVGLGGYQAYNNRSILN